MFLFVFFAIVPSSDAEMDKWVSLEMQIQMVGSFLTWFLRSFESQIQFVDYLIYKRVKYLISPYDLETLFFLP
jgi:hypothetical protein